MALSGQPPNSHIMAGIISLDIILSRENPSTGQTHAGSIRGPPAINQQEQCILGGGGNSHFKMAGGN